VVTHAAGSGAGSTVRDTPPAIGQPAIGQPAIGQPVIGRGAIGRGAVLVSPSAPRDEHPLNLHRQLETFRLNPTVGGGAAGVGDDVTALADEQSALRRVAGVVARGAAPEVVFDTVAREVARVLSVSSVTIDRYDHGASSTVVASVNDPGFPVGSRWVLDGPSLAASVLEGGRPARVDDYTDLRSTVAAVARDYAVSSTVGVPILLDGDVWGVICVGTKEAELLPPDTERRLATFTEVLETAISSAHSRTELMRLADAESSLRRVATLVARGAAPHLVFAGVADEVAHVLGIRSVTIDMYDRDLASTVVVAATGASGTRFAVGTRWPLDGPSLAATVLETGRPARVDDYADLQSTTADAVREYGFTSTVGVPIVVDGSTWGVVCVGSISQKQLPADVESRLAGFTELLETAISNAHTRGELTRLAAEQAALRRVATLVAGGAAPEEMFQGVALEVARLLDVRTVTIDRYDADGASTVVASTGSLFGVGSRWPLDGPSLGATVLQTGRPARIDDYSDLQSVSAAVVRAYGTRSTVGVPILADGSVWGVICVGTDQADLLPPGTERRLAGFTELLETAISNAHGRAELVASRARIASAADETRRRIERDLHDGTQQRLVSLGLRLQGLRELAPPDLDELDEALSRASEELTAVFEEVRRLSHGIHPAILSEEGLTPALGALRRRSVIPVNLEVNVDRRLPERVEVATYYVVSEALTNAAKHAAASCVEVTLDDRSSALHVVIRDDGIGGAGTDGGSGLVGLRDRVEALGGLLRVSSPEGGGTELVVTIPLNE
jgi:signal transduction histidine kinase